MKKLFATLLAATMVAGTAVSAFAAVGLSDDIKAIVGAPCSTDDDYTLAKNIFNDNGVKIKETDTISGGDKIYYPILVSKEGLDKSDAAAYNLATAASEVDDLKVALKVVRGGKYIKGAKIVRQNLPIVLGEAEGAATTINATDADNGKNAIAASYKVTITEVDTTAAADVTVAGTTVTLAKDSKVNDQATAIAGAINKDTSSKFTAEASDAVITLTEKEVGKTTQTEVKGTGITIAVAETPAIEKAKATYTFDLSGIKKDNIVTIANAGKIADFAFVSATDFETKVEAGKQYDVTITGDSAKLVAKAEEKKADAVTLSHKTPGTDNSNKKVYCVEVELGDYFGTQATEVDFDLSLRTRSTQYGTKDADESPKTSFDLGKDAKEGKDVTHGVDMFIHGTDKTTVKFRNNELTLGINKYTGSINLDKAWTANAAKEEDVERIFLEGDDFNYEVKASDQGELFLEFNQDANKKVIVANQDAKMNFFNFPGKPEFDFTGDAKFTVEDPDKSYYFYEIVDDKPVKTSAKYDKEDECFVLRTRTLGSYVISDKELEAAEADKDADKDSNKPADKPATETPVTPTNPGKNVPTGAIA